MENCCTLRAPRSRPLRHIATKTPIRTITAQMSRILNANGAIRLFRGKLPTWMPKHECAIDLLVVRRGLETNPTKGQRKCHGRCDQASPGKKPMRRPARFGTALDEALQHDVVPENAGQTRQSYQLVLPVAERFATRGTSKAVSVDAAATSRSDNPGQTRKTRWLQHRKPAPDRSLSSHGCRPRCRQ